MTSSGTTGQQVSKIFIDKETALLQQKVLIKLLNDFIGKSRLPMLIIDSPLILKKRDMFSSRGAVILSFNFISVRNKYFFKFLFKLRPQIFIELIIEFFVFDF